MLCYFFMSFVLFIEQMEHNTLPSTSFPCRCKGSTGFIRNGRYLHGKSSSPQAPSVFPTQAPPVSSPCSFKASAEGMSDGRNITYYKTERRKSEINQRFRLSASTPIEKGNHYGWNNTSPVHHLIGRVITFFQ